LFCNQPFGATQFFKIHREDSMEKNTKTPQ